MSTQYNKIIEDVGLNITPFIDNLLISRNLGGTNIKE